MGDPLRQHDHDDDAHRRGEDLVAQLRALGLTDEEILSDEGVEMTIEGMDAWLKSGAPSPFVR
jgi:hypothetical protein